MFSARYEVPSLFNLYVVSWCDDTFSNDDDDDDDDENFMAISTISALSAFLRERAVGDDFKCITITTWLKRKPVGRLCR